MEHPTGTIMSQAIIMEGAETIESIDRKIEEASRVQSSDWKREAPEMGDDIVHSIQQCIAAIFSGKCVANIYEY